jgi:hypothetical protein
VTLASDVVRRGGLRAPVRRPLWPAGIVLGLLLLSIALVGSAEAAEDPRTTSASGSPQALAWRHGRGAPARIVGDTTLTRDNHLSKATSLPPGAAVVRPVAELVELITRPLVEPLAQGALAPVADMLGPVLAAVATPTVQAPAPALDPPTTSGTGSTPVTRPVTTAPGDATSVGSPPHGMAGPSDTGSATGAAPVLPSTTTRVMGPTPAAGKASLPGSASDRRAQGTPRSVADCARSHRIPGHGPGVPCAVPGSPASPASADSSVGADMGTPTVIRSPDTTVGGQEYRVTPHQTPGPLRHSHKPRTNPD